MAGLIAAVVPLALVSGASMHGWALGVNIVSPTVGLMMMALYALTLVHLHLQCLHLQCFQLLNRVPWGRISSFMVRLALQAVLTDFFVKIMMFLMVLSMFFVIINVDRTRMFLEAILATYESAERRVTLQTVDPLIPFAQPKRRSLIANPKI